MKNVINILKKTGAILDNDHFVGTSGKHLDTYINPDKLFPHTKETSQVCKLFAEKYKNEDIDVVVGPAIGGIILSTWTAYFLSKLKGKEIYGLFTEKDTSNNQVFSRGFDELVKGKKVLVVEDITTTGGSLVKAVKSVQNAGGIVVAACTIINRDLKNVTSDVIGAPFSSLGVIKAQSFDAETCPLCKKNVPVNIKIGHGKKFVESKKKI